MTILNKTTIIRSIMFIVNFIVIVFMSVLIYHTTGLINEYDMARNFIEKIKSVPTVPWKVPFYSISLLFILYITVVIREKKFKYNIKAQYLFCIMDTLICVVIVYCLNMGYRGVILIAIANVVIYISNKKRIIFIVINIIVYVILDYDIISISNNIFSINDYIQYYSFIERMYIFGIRTILISTNEILFILFMIFTIQSQIEENDDIKEIFLKLSKYSKELKIVNIQLQDYGRKSEEMAKIRERNRLAREIHDTLGHTLTSIATGLEACIDLFDINISKVKTQLVKISEVSRKGLLEVRRSVSELRPDALERLSLVPAIQKLAEDINECTTTRVDVEVNLDTVEINADEEETIYRVVQEGITNAVRHGNASKINVALNFEAGLLNICITDNGIGCDDMKPGFGFKHIKERVDLLKGEVDFFSKVGQGFKIIVYIPIRGR